MILAAGLGTRLKPLTDTMPKALVNVGGMPLLQRLIEKLRRAGARRIVVNVHHFASQVTDFLRQNDNFGMDVRVSDESDRLLDTGGALRKARPLFLPDMPILIHNVDILSNADLRQLYDKAADGAPAHLLVSRRQTTRRLLFDSNHNLVAWTDTRTGEVRSPYDGHDIRHSTPLAFSGIHIVSPALFPLMDDMGEKFGIIDFYLRICAQVCVRATTLPDLQLLDVGKTDSLAEAEHFLQNL